MQNICRIAARHTNSNFIGKLLQKNGRFWHYNPKLNFHQASLTWYYHWNLKPYSQNQSKVNHKFNIVWIEWFGKFQCKQMQNICEIAWVNNKTLRNENWLPQHTQSIVAVKNFCSKTKNFYILTQKWNT